MKKHNMREGKEPWLQPGNWKEVLKLYRDLNSETLNNNGRGEKRRPERNNDDFDQKTSTRPFVFTQNSTPEQTRAKVGLQMFGPLSYRYSNILSSGGKPVDFYTNLKSRS